MAGAKVNAAEETQGQTPLMYAALENHAAAVKVLVEGGADVNAKSKPLEWPEFKFNTGGMIYTLQPVGGWTAAMYAARDGAIDAVRALADARRGPEPGRSRRHHAADPGDRQRQVRYGGRAARQGRQSRTPSTRRA